MEQSEKRPIGNNIPMPATGGKRALSHSVSPGNGIGFQLTDGRTMAQSVGRATTLAVRRVTGV